MTTTTTNEKARMLAGTPEDMDPSPARGLAAMVEGLESDLEDTLDSVKVETSPLKTENLGMVAELVARARTLDRILREVRSLSKRFGASSRFRHSDQVPDLRALWILSALDTWVRSVTSPNGYAAGQKPDELARLEREARNRAAVPGRHALYYRAEALALLVTEPEEAEEFYGVDRHDLARFLAQTTVR